MTRIENRVFNKLQLELSTVGWLFWKQNNHHWPYADTYYFENPDKKEKIELQYYPVKGFRSQKTSGCYQIVHVCEDLTAKFYGWYCHNYARISYHESINEVCDNIRQSIKLLTLGIEYEWSHDIKEHWNWRINAKHPNNAIELTIMQPLNDTYMMTTYHAPKEKDVIIYRADQKIKLIIPQA